MKLRLPEVTLLQVDTTNPERAKAAMAICESQVEFGASVLLTSAEIPHVNSYEAYNKFIVTDLHKYFCTSHVLLMQWDGFVINANAWKPEFLKYDYIGAPWYSYGPNREVRVRENGIVGNGGFSLRSKDFCLASSYAGMVMQAQNSGFTFAPEDQLLCNGPGWGCVPNPAVREIIESRGIKYAPVEIASLFSWELHDNDPEYRGQFGFHGTHTMERLKALRIL